MDFLWRFTRFLHCHLRSMNTVCKGLNLSCVTLIWMGKWNGALSLAIIEVKVRHEIKAECALLMYRTVRVY